MNYLYINIFIVFINIFFIVSLFIFSNHIVYLAFVYCIFILLFILIKFKLTKLLIFFEKCINFYVTLLSVIVFFLFIISLYSILGLIKFIFFLFYIVLFSTFVLICKNLKVSNKFINIIKNKNYSYYFKRMMIGKFIFIYIYVFSGYSLCGNNLTKTMHNYVPSDTLVLTTGAILLVGGISYASIKGYKFFISNQQDLINKNFKELDNKLINIDNKITNNRIEMEKRFKSLEIRIENDKTFRSRSNSNLSETEVKIESIDSKLLSLENKLSENIKSNGDSFNKRFSVLEAKVGHNSDLMSQRFSELEIRVGNNSNLISQRFSELETKVENDSNLISQRFSDIDLKMDKNSDSLSKRLFSIDSKVNEISLSQQTKLTETSELAGANKAKEELLTKLNEMEVLLEKYNETSNFNVSNIINPKELKSLEVRYGELQELAKEYSKITNVPNFSDPTFIESITSNIRSEIYDLSNILTRRVFKINLDDMIALVLYILDQVGNNCITYISAFHIVKIVINHPYDDKNKNQTLSSVIKDFLDTYHKS